MIKNGWTRVAFGNVVRQVRDTVDPERAGLERYVAGEHMETDDLRIRRWGVIGDGYLGPAFHMRFKKGHVLYGSRRTYLRKIAVADFEGVTANTTFVLESKDSKVLMPELLPFIMQTDSFHEHAIKQSKGSVNPYINFSDLTWYEFDLPPLDEQRRIARVLQEVDVVGEGYLRLANSLSAVEVGLLENAMRATNSGLFRVTELLLEPPRNGISPLVNAQGAGLRTVSISAIRNGIFDPTGCVKFANISQVVARSFLVKRGDCFVIRGNGNRNICGKAGLSDHSYDDLFYPDLLIRLRFNPDRILPEFAVAQWNLPSVHARLAARAKSSNGIWKVNGQDIRAHHLSVPPLNEQTRLVETISNLRRMAQMMSARINVVAELRSKILKSGLIR